MKLKMYYVDHDKIQEWLDKYQEKIKFIFRCNQSCDQNQVVIVIDES